LIRVCYPFVGDSVGGAQISTLSLIRALPSAVEPVIVVHQDGPLSKLLDDEKIPYIGLPLASLAGQQPTPWRQLRAMSGSTAALWRFLRRDRIDVVHTQDGRMHASWWLAARLASVPHVWHQRSQFVDSRLLRFMMGHVAAVVVNSETARASLPAGAVDGVSVIANPIEAPRPGMRSERDSLVRQAVQAGARVQPDTFILAAVGNLRAVKQPQLLADAVARAASLTDRPLLLVLFGDDREGWISRMSDALRSAGGRAGLVHLGFRHPIEDWLKGCDALVATSNGDAFGRTLVEAMGVGIPVIAVDAGGHREIVTHDHDGLLAADGDPGALAEAVARIAGDQALRQRLVDAGRARAHDFAPGLHAARIMAVYRAILPAG
jgi:glycosyltransferase involved in cell wall biosynthesis